MFLALSLFISVVLFVGIGFYLLYKKIENTNNHLPANMANVIHQVFDAKHKSQLETTENVLDNKLKQSNEILTSNLHKSEILVTRQKESLENTVNPISITLAKLNQKIEQLEQANVKNTSFFTTSMQSLQDSTIYLNKETSKLSQALRKPETRGKWGELQLKRVLEMSGMIEHCDFITQDSVVDSNSNLFRPDVRVNLPGNKCIIIDSKVPFEAYLSASESENVAEQKKLLTHHALKVKERVKELSDKSYWAKFTHSPDFVVLFLPSENLFSSALDYDPSLIEYGSSKNVLIATPTTLITLLKSISYGWNQQNLEENYTQIVNLAEELYTRLSTMCEHFDKVGKNLTGATKAYNDSVGSFETRVLSTAKKIKELGISSDKRLPELHQIELMTRTIKPIEVKK